MNKNEAIQLFGDKQEMSISSAEQEAWHVSIIDFVAVLTESVEPSAFWKKLKKRLKAEGNETVINCHTLKMLAADIFPSIEIVHTLCSQFTVEYGKGSGEKQLRQCMTFAQAFPEKEIVYTLCRQLKALQQIISKIGHELATHLNASVIGSKSIILNLKWLNLTTLKCTQVCKILC